MKDRAVLSHGQRIVPPSLVDADDLPQALSDVPLWSENYLSQAYDPVIETGVYMHFSRMPNNPRIWEGVFAVYLPGDRFLLQRDLSWDTRKEGPGNNMLKYQAITPFERWRKTFHGGAQLVGGDELRAGAIKDGPHVYVEMDLTFTAKSPALHLRNMGEQFWGREHYEQHGDYTGTVRFDGAHLGLDGASYAFKGTGMRDHSHGPRDTRPMKNSAWLHGEFPSGRSFLLFHVLTQSGAGDYEFFRVGEDDEFIQVELTSLPPLIDDQANALDPYELHFTGPDGTPSVIRAEPLQAVPFSFVGPNEWILGPHPDAHHLCIETMSRFEWDGEVGYGNSERSVFFPGR